MSAILKWNCQLCTFENYLGALQCKQCGAENRTMYKPSFDFKKMVKCDFCGNYYHSEANVCLTCDNEVKCSTSVAKEAWSCELCKCENSADFDKCAMCESVRKIGTDSLNELKSTHLNLTGMGKKEVVKEVPEVKGTIYNGLDYGSNGNPKLD